MSTSATSSSSMVSLSPLECQTKWPFLKPKAGCDTALFDSSAGIIDPLEFIAAQNHNTKQQIAAGSFSATTTNVVDNNATQLEIISDVAVNIQTNGVVDLALGKQLRATQKESLCGVRTRGHCSNKVESGTVLVVMITRPQP